MLQMLKAPTLVCREDSRKTSQDWNVYQSVEIRKERHGGLFRRKARAYKERRRSGAEKEQMWSFVHVLKLKKNGCFLLGWWLKLLEGQKTESRACTLAKGSHAAAWHIWNIHWWTCVFIHVVRCVSCRITTLDNKRQFSTLTEGRLNLNQQPHVAFKLCFSSVKKYVISTMFPHLSQAMRYINNLWKDAWRL